MERGGFWGWPNESRLASLAWVSKYKGNGLGGRPRGAAPLLPLATVAAALKAGRK